MRTELQIIEAFVKRVNTRAEANILKTHKLEGSHYAAMTVELRLLQEADTCYHCEQNPATRDGMCDTCLAEWAEKHDDHNAQ